MENLRNYALDSNIFFGCALFDENTMYAVQTVELPGLSVNHQRENTKVGVINLQGDISEYNPIDISLIIDEDLIVWREIIGIMQKYHPQGTNTCNNFLTECWLEIRDNKNNYLFKVQLHNCYFKTVNNLEYSTTKDNEVLSLRITLEYDYFDIV